MSGQGRRQQASTLYLALCWAVTEGLQQACLSEHKCIGRNRMRSGISLQTITLSNVRPKFLDLTLLHYPVPLQRGVSKWPRGALSHARVNPQLHINQHCSTADLQTYLAFVSFILSKHRLACLHCGPYATDTFLIIPTHCSGCFCISYKCSKRSTLDYDHSSACSNTSARSSIWNNKHHTKHFAVSLSGLFLKQII